MPDLQPLYDTADRLAPAELAELARLARASRVTSLLDHLPVNVILIARTRQIVFANTRFLTFCGTEEGKILGARIGEALGCVHPPESSQGCGTTKFCDYCGAGIAILKSLRDEHETLECSIERSVETSLGRHLDALNLQAWTATVDVDGHSMVLCTLIDISHEKRLKAVERMFFHDILNVSGGMQGLCQVMAQGIVQATEEDLNLLAYASERINEIILSQQEFQDVEHGEYQCRQVKLGTLETLGDLLRYFAKQHEKWARMLRLAEDCQDLVLSVDKRLLLRALINMLKNALEASAPGDEVVLGCRAEGDQVRLWVRNSGVMPVSVQLQIFHKSFSTKGEGRGLGTYSIKLFAEKYLGGRAEFVSTEAEQTVFSLLLPAHGACTAPGLLTTFASPSP